MAFLAKGRSRCNMQLEPGVLTNKAGQVCAETGNPVVRLLLGVRALFRKLGGTRGGAEVELPPTEGTNEE